MRACVTWSGTQDACEHSVGGGAARRRSRSLTPSASVLTTGGGARSAVRAADDVYVTHVEMRRGTLLLSVSQNALCVHVRVIDCLCRVDDYSRSTRTNC
jgi:hypothetical protein